MGNNKYKFLSYPIHMGLAVTSKCNLKCVYCRTAEAHDMPCNEELSQDEIFRLLDEFAVKKVFLVCLYGGEPFVRKDIKEIIQYALQFKYRLLIPTNGTVLSDGIIKLIKDNRKKFALQLSLDSGHRETNDQLRGSGAYSQVVRNLKRLKEKEVFYDSLAAVVTRINWQRLSSLPQLAQDYNIRKINLTSFAQTGRGQENAPLLSMDDQENEKAAMSIYTMVAKNRHIQFDGNMLNRAMNILLYMKKITAGYSNRMISINNCNVGRGRLMIKPDGSVVPCGAFWDYKHSNLRETSIYDIWREDPLISIIRETVKLENDYCTSCEMKAFCRGICMADIFLRGGKMNYSGGACKLLGKMWNEYSSA